MEVEIAALVALQLSLAEGLVAACDEVWAAGDAVLPVDPGLSPAATAALLDRVRPARHHHAAGVETDDDAPPVPAGTALVVATSGSTGVPRGVVLTHTTLGAATARSRERLGAADGAPWLGVLPLHHVAGMSVVLRSRAAGVEPLLDDGPLNEVVADAAPSWVSLVPTQLSRLLAAGTPLAHHHGVLLGGAAAAPALLAGAAAAGVAVTTSYGMTETCGGCVYDGIPLDDVEVRAVDGVLEVRGPVTADGLRSRDGTVRPVTGADGWLRTSDRGGVDVDGRVVVHGRADDVVVSGGENVPLPPVRTALAQLPAVTASAVVGLPDERWGTAVTAVVVPTADAPPPTLAALRDALRRTLPAMHLPTRLVVVDTLPRDGLGKVTPQTVATAAQRTSDDLDRT